jgi:hypothetical protein
VELTTDGGIAVLADHTAISWGAQQSGIRGDNSTFDPLDSVTPVLGLTGIKQIACSRNFFCFATYNTNS